MKKQIALFSIVAAALIAVPVLSRAADSTPSAPEQTAPAKKHGGPFRGKVAAVDTTAMTLTVGTQTYNVTSDTKITKDGKPATLADLTVGTLVGGSYKKDGDKLNALVIHAGERAKKKAAQ